jgi:hypothetical protein
MPFTGPKRRLGTHGLRPVQRETTEYLRGFTQLLREIAQLTSMQIGN